MSASIGDTSNKTDDIVIEPCLEINQLDAITVRAGFNGLLKDAPRNVSTSIVNGISQQLIYQLNLLVPNALLSCDDFNIDVGDAAYPCLRSLAKQTLQKAIQARIAIVEIEEVSASHSWAEVIATQCVGKIEQGAQAVMLSLPVDLVLGVSLVRKIEGDEEQQLPPELVVKQAVKILEALQWLIKLP